MQGDSDCSNTYEWCADGIEPRIEKLKNIPKKDMEQWLQRFEQKQNVIIRDVKSVKGSEFDCLPSPYVQSVAVSPIHYNNRLIGFYGLDNPPEKYMDDISDLFLIVGYFIALLIRRRDLLLQLEETD
jgi:hypothetical protein